MPKPHYLDDAIEGRESKKPRFDARNPSTLAADAPEEDTILDLDEIGKGGLQAKRNAVRLEGYESDSSNENFDARADAKAKVLRHAEKSGQGQKAKEEDENDMFADIEEEQFDDGDEDEDLTREGKKRKKEVRFMEEREIEGQVASSKSGGHVSADFSVDGSRHHDAEHDESSEESVAEEERDQVDEGIDGELGAGAKKKHAPRLDAFNMRGEAEEGRFDASGNFVRNAIDPNAVHDSWLEGSSKSDMRKAKAAEEKREQDRRKRDMEDDAVPIGESLKALMVRMQPEETVLEALQRLGASKDKKKKPKWQKNKRSKGQDMDVDASMQPDEPGEATRKADVEAITAAADRLLTQGQADIYDQERAMLQRQYRRETGEEWAEAQTKDSQADKAWQYRWSDGRDGGDVHGPYDGATMAAWDAAGYFGEEVEFKETGGEAWSRSVAFT